MTKRLLSLLVFLLFFAPAIKAQENNCLLVGDYLPPDYIQQILITKSPIEAEAKCKESLITGRVAIIDNIYRILVGGYYDAVSLYILDDCITPVNLESYPLGESFKRIDSNRFSVDYYEETIEFLYVGDNSSMWIAFKLFEGSWEDHDGRNYQFLSNQKATVNDKEVTCSVGRTNPRVYGKVVDILVLDSNKFAFEFTSENTVELYELLKTKIAETPKYTLNRITH